MNEVLYRALIVEDDEVARDITVHGLEHEGFHCDVASDGLQAMEMVRQHSYDLVVTDLQMPNRNGHALAVELLQQEHRPLIIILTGLMEPRLVKDLLTRGVDDIIWKPVASYEFFAAKIKSLLHRRSATGHAPAPVGPDACPPHPADCDSHHDATVTMADMEARLACLATIPPISHAALDVYAMTGDSMRSAEQLAAAAARDPSLAAELLRLANGLYYNPSCRKIVELEEAITRIGQKRVGELALVAGTSIALSRSVIPWMDFDRIWRCSLASGVAVELLIAEGDHDQIKEGLLLSAIMHALGRVVLASLYPKHYRQMTAECASGGQSLVDRERDVFPENHAQVMARLLASWKIPPEVSQPLTFVLDDYAALARLPEPTRMKVELVKLAVLMARIAVGGWEIWDCVELPPTTLLKRLRIKDPASILAQTKTDAESILSFGATCDSAAQTICVVPESDGGADELRYVAFAADSFDFLAAIIEGMGISLTDPAQRMEDLAGDALFNCLGTTSLRIPGSVMPQHRRAVTIICDAPQADKYHEHGDILTIPVSYGVLQSACRKIASKKVATAAAR